MLRSIQLHEANDGPYLLHLPGECAWNRRIRNRLKASTKYIENSDGQFKLQVKFYPSLLAVYKSVLNCIQTARICYHAPRAWWHHLVNVDKLQWLTGTLTLSSYELCDLDLWPFRLINQSWTRVPLCHYRMFLSDSMSPDWFFTYHAENIHRVYIHAKIQTGRRTDGRTDELLPVMGTS